MKGNPFLLKDQTSKKIILQARLKLSGIIYLLYKGVGDK